MTGSEDTAPEEFGWILNRLRRQAGLTQEELADRAGLSARGIRALERGGRPPRAFTLRSLVEALELSTQDRDRMIGAAGRVRRPGLHEGPDPDRGMPLGRDAELRSILAHLAGKTVRQVLLLTGPPGIGKTQLLQEATRLARMSDVPVLSGACHRFGGHAGAPLFPTLAAADQGGSDADTAAVRVDRLARRGHVLLVLDDLQWITDEGLATLASVVRESRRVRVLAAYRGTEVGVGHPLSGFVSELVGADAVTHVGVGPLTPSAAEAVLDRATGGAEVLAPGRIRALRVAGGVPLYLEHLGRALASMSDAWSDELPWELVHVVRDRIMALPAQTVAALDVLAAGTSVDPVTLPGDDDLAPAIAAGLVRDDGDGARLVDEVVARVLRDGLATGRRCEVDRGLVPAVVHERRDAKSLAQVRTSTASDLYGLGRFAESAREADLAVGPAAASDDLSVLASAYLWRGLAGRMIGRGSAAIADLHAAESLAVRQADDSLAGHARTGLAISHFYAGRLRQADRYFRQVLDEARRAGDRALVARTEGNLAVCAYCFGDWGPALDQYARAIEVGSATSRWAEAWARLNRVEMLILAHRFDEARADLRLVVALPQELDIVRRATTARAVLEVRAGRPQNALRYLGPLLDRDPVPEWYVTEMLPTVAAAHLAAGDLNRASAVASSAVLRSRAAVHVPGLVDALRVAAVVDAHRGAHARSRSLVDEALGITEVAGSPVFELHAREALAEVERVCGRGTDPGRADAAVIRLRADLASALPEIAVEVR
ncbi:AAA family ATPase [Amycolatopsis thailandensis]|uniref:AAA family ATPase n=1 Tax=Amycolatopsis thailandensis TaxID=589330 RepID=UPI00365C0A05